MGATPTVIVPNSKGFLAPYGIADTLRTLRPRTPWLLFATANGATGVTSQTPIDIRPTPNPAHPFGRANPAAPYALRQLDFIIGEFDCVDIIRNPDGTTTLFNANFECALLLERYGDPR